MLTLIANILILALVFFNFRKGKISINLLFALSILVYFYPILLFNELIVYSQGLRGYETSFEARLIIYLSLLVLLLTKPIYIVDNKIISNNNLLIKTCTYSYVFLGSALAIALIFSHGISLGSQSKSEMMANLGYTYKLFSINNIMVIALAFMTRSKWLKLFSLSLCTLDLLYGFRGGLAIFIVGYLLSLGSSSQKFDWSRIRLIMVGIVFVPIMILIKETAYFSKDVFSVVTNLANLSSDDGASILMLANIESTSVSIVFSEVVRSNFNVSFNYIMDSFFAAFPFIDMTGLKIISFASYYKGSLFGQEGDSFASGAFAVSYALGGVVGVFIMLVMILMVARKYRSAMLANSFILRLFAYSSTSALIVTVFRSDFIFTIGLIKSVFIMSIAPLVLHKLLVSSAKK